MIWQDWGEQMVSENIGCAWFCMSETLLYALFQEIQMGSYSDLFIVLHTYIG